MRSLLPRSALVVTLCAAAWGASACGPEPAPIAPPMPPPPTAATAPVAPSVPTAPAMPTAPVAPPAAPGSFFGMTPEQKLNHMKMVIQPTMGKVFQAYDGKRYGEFGCRTCHGPDKKDTHDALPKLTLSGGGFAKLGAEKPAVMKFMAEQVTPTMAKAMGETPFDPATKKGFGCGGCHAVN